jgi:RNA polymerase sigma-70 factor (ECF subfamily)
MEAGRVSDRIALLLPDLRRYGQRLSGNSVLAEDLAQEAATLALENMHQFNPDTSLPAWLLTILRNLFVAHRKRMAWEVEDPNLGAATNIQVDGGQEAICDLKRVFDLLKRRPMQRYTLAVALTAGLKSTDTAELLGIASGTVRSRIFVARRTIEEEIGVL